MRPVRSKGQFYRNCASNITLRDLIRDILKNETSVVHSVHNMLNLMELEGNKDSKDCNETLLSNEIDVFDDTFECYKATDDNMNGSAENAEEGLETKHITNHFATSGLNAPKTYLLDHGDVGLKNFCLADN